MLFRIGIIVTMCLPLVCTASDLPRPQTDSVALQIDPQYGRRRNQQSPDEVRIERERVKAMNKDRQRQLKTDTDKLLQLATELKEYVDKTNENILSIEVIKKTDEIEKLAKSVREKMKTYYEEPGNGTTP